MQQLMKYLIIVMIVLKMMKYNSKICNETNIIIMMAIWMIMQERKRVVEGFDGSSIAFDADAFKNLNRVVNEIAGSGNLTIPANLIVKGKTICESDINVKGTTTFENNVKLNGNKSLTLDTGKIFINKQKLEGNPTHGFIGPKFLASSFKCQDGKVYIDRTKGIVGTDMRITKDARMDGSLTVYGEGKFQNIAKKGTWSHINAKNGNAYLRGNVVVDGHNGTGNQLDVRTVRSKIADTDTLKGHAWGGNRIRLLSTIQSDKNKIEIDPTGSMRTTTLNFGFPKKGETQNRFKYTEKHVLDHDGRKASF